jgi:peptidoglycan/LPS O-acetylase OafA/YrhL
MAVILYHFGLSAFGGGFVGVDVFFVISGFLMTQIIVGGLEKRAEGSGFSLLGFYLARARRIVPALLALCATLLLVGWLILPSIDYRLLAKHVISSLKFISNIRFLREAGYFDAASHEKWLLHTWSLSVEWQFYLILPLMLMATWKLRPGRHAATVFVSAAFIASLAFSVFLTSIEPAASFYLLPTRAWEMLAGGIIYLVSHRIVFPERGRKTAELLGFGLILSSVLMFSSKTAWPGSWAMVPVLGTVLVLCAARSMSVWTGSRIAQWLGTRSYSLYLWHWPIVVALVYFDLQQNVSAIAAGLAVTLVLGHLSYVLVENPTRRHLEQLRWGIGAAGLGLASLAVATPAITVRQQDGVNGRFSPQVQSVFDEAEDKNPRMSECHVAGPTPVPGCIYGGPRLGAIVIGDSHAASIMHAVETILPNKSLHVLDWSMTGCPTLIGVKKIEGSISPNCGEFIKSALVKQTELPKDVPLIIMNRTSAYAFGANDVGRESEPFPRIYFDQPVDRPTTAFLNEFRAAIIGTACEFSKTRPVYLVRPMPEMKLNVPKVMGRALLIGEKRDVSISLDEYHRRNRFVWEAQDAARDKCGARILDPLPLLCSDGRCHGAKYGRPLYYDGDHLSEYGAKFLAPMFAQVFAKK